MDNPKFIVSNQKEESICKKRVKSIPNCRVGVSAYLTYSLAFTLRLLHKYKMSYNACK